LVVGIDERKTSGKRTFIWENNIKTDLNVIGWEIVEWLHLAEVRGQWRGCSLKWYLNLGFYKMPGT
jgi:hypothetical protein